MTKNIHQLIVGASLSDAITQMALAIRDQLRVDGESEIFALYLGHDAIQAGILPFNLLPDDEATIIYHSSFGVPELTDKLVKLGRPITLIYHNITPSSYYERFDHEFAQGLAWGRQELEILRDQVSTAIAVSEFNATELKKIGFKNVVVMAAGLNPYRLESCNFDIALAQSLDHRFPNGYVLSVSQVLPHKRMEIAIMAIHLLRSIFEMEIGLVIAGPWRNHLYLQELLQLIDHLPGVDVHFTGEVSESSLATLYRQGLVFLSTSDHEGLSLPPLEAMAARTPVVARGTSALPETIGDGGILLPPESTPIEIAGVIGAVLRNRALRSGLISAGLSRLRSLSENSQPSHVADLIRSSIQ